MRAPRLDETAGLVPLMTAQVVEDDDVARLELGELIAYLRELTAPEREPGPASD